MLDWGAGTNRFWLAFSWFASVQAVQLSWLSATDYMGLCILIVYAGLLAFLGMQFAFFSKKIDGSPIGFLEAASLSGAWVLFEWMRLFISAGFTWNPAGMALACSEWSLRAVSLFGIYGLSFWAIFVNLIALRSVQKKTVASAAAWVVCMACPYIFGIAQEVAFRKSAESLRAVLVQTALSPEEKDGLFGGRRAIDPLDQWDRIVQLIEAAEPKEIDLIALPEGTLPIEAFRPAYRLAEIEHLWAVRFHSELWRDAPPLQPPLAEKIGSQHWFVSNAFIAQALANHYRSELIAGFDRVCQTSGKHYNAAFHFVPGRGEPLSFYDKQMLVPMGEYIPLKGVPFFSNLLARWFDLGSPFEAGEKPGVFFGKVPIGLTICYEETYGHLVSRTRQIGAELLVNISNDIWFPRSKLARQHFDHGMIRGVENGIPVLRACNTGITGGVDCFGRIVASLPPEKAGALIVEIPRDSCPSLYSLWGDWAILALAVAGSIRVFTKQAKPKLLQN